MSLPNEPVLLAVNGTLMRGLELNPNLLAVGATFVRETATEPAYRLWTINDRHPAMVRVKTGGVSVAVEDGAEVLGVLGEPILCEGQKEITSFGGWRAYTASQKK